MVKERFGAFQFKPFAGHHIRIALTDLPSGAPVARKLPCWMIGISHLASPLVRPSVQPGTPGFP